MKRHAIRFLIAALVFCALLCLAASALAFTTGGKCGENVRWSLDYDSKTITIYGSGPMDDYPDERMSPWEHFWDSIRTVIIDEGVTSIGSHAFSGSSVRTVKIADSVATVGANPFATYSLSTVILSVHHPYLEMIDGALCTKADKKLICYPNYNWDDTVTIPRGVEIIGERAFADFVNTDTFIIPDTVKTIEKEAFRGCKRMTSIDIPASVTSMGANPFSGCTELATVRIAPGHPYLTVVDGVLFSKPDHRLIFYPYGTHIYNYVVPDGTEIMGSVAFPYSLDLSVELPDSVTTLEDYALRGLGMSKLTIPSSVTKIGKRAVSSCESLTEVVIPDSVTEIGDFAFGSNLNLEHLTIPDSVVSLGANPVAGSGYDAMTITVSPDHPYLEMVDGVLYSKPDHRLVCITTEFTGTSLAVKEGTRIIGASAFDSFGKQIESITLPDSVEIIEAEAFKYCENLKSINLPSGLKELGEGAFYGCFSLEEIEIPEGITALATEVFGSAGLKHVTIPSSVRAIGDYAFSGCSHLESMTIPATVKSMGLFALPDAIDCEAEYTVYSGTAAEAYCRNYNQQKVILLDNPGTEAPEEEPPAAPAVPEPADPDSYAVSAGSTVIFGRYEQDNNLENGPEDLQWLILEKDGDEAVMISRYGLQYMKFTEHWDSEAVWVDSPVRAWLNTSFLADAFNEAERVALCSVYVDNSAAQGNSEWSRDGGNDTSDAVWLLSWAEALKYFRNDTARICEPTSYAIAAAEKTTFPSYRTWMRTDSWWLRSPGDETEKATVVLSNGMMIANYGSGENLVRPVIRVSLPKLEQAERGAAQAPAEPQQPEPEPVSEPEPQEPAREPEEDEYGAYGDDDYEIYTGDYPDNDDYEDYGDFMIAGPKTTWDGTIPDGEEYNEQLRKLYWHVGVYRNESNGYMLTIMNNSMTGLDYTMVADFPGIGSFEMNYVTVSQDAKYVIFYSENGEIEAHVHLPTDRNPRVKYYLFNPDLQEMIGTGVVEYDTWDALPGSYDRDPRRVWVNDWYDWDNDAALSIYENGNGTYHFVFQRDPVYLEYDVQLERDYELNGFETPDGQYYVHMWLDGVNGCCLELEIQKEDWRQGDLYYEYLAEPGTGYAKMFNFYAEEYPPDLTLYGWRPWFDNSGYDEIVFDDWADPFGETQPAEGAQPQNPQPATLVGAPVVTAAPAPATSDHTAISIIDPSSGIFKSTPEEAYWWIIWLRKWSLKDDPNTTLDFTDKGNFDLLMNVNFDPSPVYQQMLRPNSITAQFTDPAYYADVELRLSTGRGGMLTMVISHPRMAAKYGNYELQPEGTLYLEFVPDEPVPTYEDYVAQFETTVPSGDFETIEEPAQEQAAEEAPSTSDEGSMLNRMMVFNVLKYVKLQASSGAGAWEGHLRVDGKGNFTGDYYDEDFDQVEQVDFSGRFGKVEATGDGRFILTVAETATEKTPGTREEGEYGETITYSDSLLPAGSRWLLTLPGTKDELIPEMVQELITGTYGGWENPSDFVTLTEVDTGWGFFARTTDSSDPNVFNRDLFWNDSYGYNNDLAIIAAKLSWEIEDPKSEKIRSLFRKYYLDDNFFGVRNADKKKDWERDYREWTEGGDGAFAIGKKVMSFYEKDDTTVFVIVGRGTMGSEAEEWWTDFAGNYGAAKQLAGYWINWNIARYENNIWQAFGDFLNKYGVSTPHVKILITGHSLGGAMANAFAAHFIKEFSHFTELEGKLTQRDIYVYTFGAINVLRQMNNVTKGFENIHNIYNVKDSFSLRGNKGFLFVSNQGQKFGHTDLYSWTVKEDGIKTTNNHEMDNYMHALENDFVHCSLSYDARRTYAKSSSSGSIKASVQSIGYSFANSWVRNWYLNGDPDTTVRITRNDNGTLHVTVHIHLILEFEFDVIPDDYRILRFTDSTGRISGYLIIDENGTLYLYIDEASPILQDGTAGEYFRNNTPSFVSDDPPDMSRYTSDGEAAEGGTPVFRTPETGEGTTVISDETISVVFLDRAMSNPAYEGDESWPYYRFAVTNRLDIDIIIHLGFAGREGGWGTVDGAALRDLLIYLTDGSIAGDELVIPAGSTVELALRPVGGGYGFRTVEELVNVVFRFHVTRADGSSEDEWHIDYDLQLNGGASAPQAEESTTVEYSADGFGFVYEIPENWITVTEEQRIHIFLPAALAGTADETILITIPWEDLEAGLAASGGYTESEGVLGGRAVKTWRGATEMYCFIRLDSGLEIVIIIRWDESLAQVLEPLIDSFLSSIRFTGAAQAEPAQEPASEPEPEPVPDADEVNPDELEDAEHRSPDEEDEDGHQSPDEWDEDEHRSPDELADAETVTLPAAENTFGLFPVDGHADCMRAVVTGISATSYIISAKDPDMFLPSNMVDGDETTCWQFSTGATKLGQAYVYVDFAAPVTLDELWMKNGFWKITDGYDQYVRNCRVKAMTIDFRYEGSADYRDPLKVTIADVQEEQIISLEGKTGVTGVRLCIQEVYKGSKFKSDVAVSELLFVRRFGQE